LSLLGKSALLIPVLWVTIIISTIGLYKLNMHLGKPHRFYRGFNNLRLSPVSREIAGVSLFYTGLLGYGFFALFDNDFMNFCGASFALLGGLSGIIGLFYMYQLYRIPARPFWNHLQTGTAFIGSMLSFGALIIAVVTVVVMPLTIEIIELLQSLSFMMALGLALEGMGHLIHARDMKKANNEGAASYYRQVTQYGKSYYLRNGLLAFNLIAVSILAYIGLRSSLGISVGLLITLSMLVMGAFGRSLFFVLVIPTTMPGAFFWKNEGFVEHARETGLADMQQTGVVYERHHAFKVGELIETLKANSVSDMVKHVKWIFGVK